MGTSHFWFFPSTAANHFGGKSFTSPCNCQIIPGISEHNFCELWVRKQSQNSLPQHSFRSWTYVSLQHCMIWFKSLFCNFVSWEKKVFWKKKKGTKNAKNIAIIVTRPLKKTFHRCWQLCENSLSSKTEKLNKCYENRSCETSVVVFHNHMPACSRFILRPFPLLMNHI